MTAQKSEALLSCGCTRTYEPLPSKGDIVVCLAHHQTIVWVVALPDRSWKGKCLDCRYSRFGEETVIQRGAERHTAGAPSHSVEITHDGHLVRTVDLDGGQTFEGIGQSFLGSLNIPTTGADVPLREDGTLDAPDHPFNKVEHVDGPEPGFPF